MRSNFKSVQYGRDSATPIVGHEDFGSFVGQAAGHVVAGTAAVAAAHMDDAQRGSVAEITVEVPVEVNTAVLIGPLVTGAVSGGVAVEVSASHLHLDCDRLLVATAGREGVLHILEHATATKRAKDFRMVGVGLRRAPRRKVQERVD